MRMRKFEDINVVDLIIKVQYLFSYSICRTTLMYIFYKFNKLVYVLDNSVDSYNPIYVWIGGGEG